MGNLERLIVVGFLFFQVVFFTFGQCDTLIHSHFPVRTLPDSLKGSSKRIYSKLDLSFRNGKVKGVKLPFFISNYASDTIWGFTIVKKTSKIQTKSFDIIVNERGDINTYKMTPADVSSLVMYKGKDSIFFRSVWFSNAMYSKIINGEIEKSDYLVNQHQGVRISENKPILLQELVRNRISLLEYHVPKKGGKSIFFIYYRNELYIYSYDFFKTKGFISETITEEQFYSAHPYRWVRLFNYLLLK